MIEHGSNKRSDDKLCNAFYNECRCQLEEGHTGSHWHSSEKCIIRWGPNRNEPRPIEEVF